MKNFLHNYGTLLISSLVFIIAAFTFYFTFFNTPDVVLEVKRNHYELPPNYITNLKLIDSLKIRKYDDGDDSLKAKMENYFYSVKHAIASLTEYKGTKYLSTYYITNNSNKKLDDFVLEIPDVEGFYSFQNTDTINTNQFSSNIKVGSIRPSQQLIVKVWSDSFSLFLNDKEKVFHNNGVVYVKKTAEVSGLFLWIYNYWMLVLFIISMACFLFIIVANINKIEITKESSTTEIKKTEHEDKIE